MILVPALVYVMGYSQHVAQGTTLALLCLPVGAAVSRKVWSTGMWRFCCSAALSWGV